MNHIFMFALACATLHLPAKADLIGSFVQVDTETVREFVQNNWEPRASFNIYEEIVIRHGGYAHVISFPREFGYTVLGFRNCGILDVRMKIGQTYFVVVETSGLKKPCLTKLVKADKAIAKDWTFEQDATIVSPRALRAKGPYGEILVQPGVREILEGRIQIP